MKYLKTYDTETLREMLQRHREQYLVMKQSGMDEPELEKWKARIDRLADEINKRNEKQIHSGKEGGL